jgi:hypothetical protein
MVYYKHHFEFAMKISAGRRSATVSQSWTCPTCNKALATAFCPACGESPLRAHDLTLRGLFSQFLQACANIDGPLLRSFRCLLTRPGALTLAYLKGQRKPYTLPLQLFLVANVLFFAMQSLTGAKIFSTPLDQHLHSDIWGGVAQNLVARRMAARGTTAARHAPVFDQAVALNAKSLIVLMVLPFALLPAMLFYRSRRPFVAHVVFSLHFYAFLLLLMCVSLAVVGVDRLFGGRGLDSTTFDHALSIALVAVCATYLYIAAGAVYGAKGLRGLCRFYRLSSGLSGFSWATGSRCC